VLAFIFDIDGTLVDSNELHVDSWDRAFRRFGKQFSREKLRAQIGKGSDQYLPEFLTPDEIKRFGKALDDFRSELFKNEYLPKVRPFPKVRPPPVKRLTRNITSTFLRSEISSKVTLPATMPRVPNRRLTSLLHHWKSLATCHRPMP
jgi:hypothetical protein